MLTSGCVCEEQIGLDHECCDITDSLIYRNLHLALEDGGTVEGGAWLEEVCHYRCL